MATSVNHLAAVYSGPLEVASPKEDDIDEEWSNYNLEWLFDPNRFDHLSVAEQVKLYQQRNLKKTKVYKVAAGIWGAPLSRKRVLIAKSEQLGNVQWPSTRTITHKSAEPSNFNSLLLPKGNTLPQKAVSSADIHEKENTAKQDAYCDWMSTRKKLRQDLDSLGLDEKWLSQKPNKTPLEQRVLTRMIEERTRQPPTPPPPEEIPLEGVLAEASPLIQRPTPLALRVIEKFLLRQKMRLLDLFQTVDKQKKWKLTRDEFRRSIKEAGIPISDVLLEDLIMTLDTDLDNVLDYRELAKGMGVWKVEKRESKKQLVSSDEVNKSPAKYSQMAGFEPPEWEEDFVPIPPSSQAVKSASSHVDRSASVSSQRSHTPGGQSGHSTESQPELEESRGSPIRDSRLRSSKSATSRGSGTSSRSSQYLEPPPPDTRPEQLILSSEEAMLDLRKRDREALARLTRSRKQKAVKTTKNLPSASRGGDLRSVIKTGDYEVDCHLAPSTLGGETAEQVNRFRQLKYREYNDVMQLCQENHLVLSERLLKKVLLYPPDKNPAHIKKHIRVPGALLHSEQVGMPRDYQQSSKASRDDKAASPTRSKTLRTAPSRDAAERHRGTDGRYSYPSHSSVRPLPTKVTLSTGKAVISRKVNCWMSFEEYDRLTRDLGSRYTSLNGRSDDNAFWPGRLLDKLRLCLPQVRGQGNAVFASVNRGARSNPGYHNDLRTWPISDGRFVQYASVDPHWNKHI